MSKDLLVVASREEAIRIQSQIADDGMMRALKDSNERFFVVWPGFPHTGRRYANCVISAELKAYLTTDKPKDSEQERAVDWWQEETLHKIMDELIVI
ncbi:hypothetical protein LAV_00004 [Sphingobium phage Lacusarx]|uniref:Uncharacterized protein n=1 Tax=Sphingobium phage Lacusarx TaxID=1980139 RepID=A0A1W6DWX8_9CAUD|nr:hypothetical protein FDH44_gp004 [Sphingobium phage Lacusarx]ARK07404.1 hypothetical protein LAV_00004 [Sphingobium phage Lacusarx]